MNKLTLWIARDGDGFLTLNTRKPTRVVWGQRGKCFWTCTTGNSLYLLDNSLCPDLKWEDEPKEITIEL